MPTSIGRLVGLMSLLDRYPTRPYAGRSDLGAMVVLLNARQDREGGEEHTTVESMAQQYEHLQRCNPLTDILLIEADDEVVGYGRTTWNDVAEGYRAYWMVAEASPQHPGLEEAIFDWAEQRAIAIAATHPQGDKRLAAWTDESSPRRSFLRTRGYEVDSYGEVLVRLSLENVPERSLPEGVEVRPVEERHLRAIWEADVEAFRDHRGYTEQTEEDWAAWLEDPHADPLLWQVAWADDEVVGQVRSFIDHEQNRRFGRLRGWTENISTHRSWRKRGVASSLICSSLVLLRERGMSEAGLGVDTENLSGAFDLYRSLGFVEDRIEAEYHRQI
ncbi:GNAT family N-acetyltransferase [soil metagenome]